VGRHLTRAPAMSEAGPIRREQSKGAQLVGRAIAREIQGPGSSCTANLWSGAAMFCLVCGLLMAWTQIDVTSALVGLSGLVLRLGDQPGKPDFKLGT